MNRHTLIGSLSAVALTAITGSAYAQALPYSYVTTLDSNSPTFNRPVAGNPPTGLSAAGPNVSFGSFIFVPVTSGSLPLETTAAALSPGAADDTFLVLYQGVFTPATPLTNILQADDDTGAGALSTMTRNLTAGTSHTLVTTTFSNGAFGPITTRISGPGSINVTASAPEPGSIALLGLVALPGVAILSRKK